MDDMIHPDTSGMYHIVGIMIILYLQTVNIAAVLTATCADVSTYEVAGN